MFAIRRIVDYIHIAPKYRSFVDISKGVEIFVHPCEQISRRSILGGGSRGQPNFVRHRKTFGSASRACWRQDCETHTTMHSKRQIARSSALRRLAYARDVRRLERSPSEVNRLGFPKSVYCDS